MTLGGPSWILGPPPPSNAVSTLSRELDLPTSLCALLVARGFSDPSAARDHLRPRLDHLHPPELLTDAPEASERITAAIAEGEMMLVHGDYDVDGICSAALLTRFLRRLGGRVGCSRSSSRKHSTWPAGALYSGLGSRRCGPVVEVSEVDLERTR